MPNTYPNDASRLAGAVAKLDADVPEYITPPKKGAKRLIRITCTLEKQSADGAAGTATTSDTSPAFRSPCAGRLLGAFFTPHAAATASDSNYFTLTIEQRNGSGGANTVMASVNCTVTVAPFSGNMAAAVNVPFTLSATFANTRFPAGSNLSFGISKTGTGLICPAGTFTFDFEEEDVVDGYPG